MKKKLALFFTVILAMACVLSGCGSKDKKTSGKKIGVIQMIENGAFNDMRDGILEEMKAKGYENVEVKCAQGDSIEDVIKNPILGKLYNTNTFERFLFLDENRKIICKNIR